MLSRVAESIYWIARYIERAENTARLIKVNSHLVLDAPKGVSPGWEPLIHITGLADDFEKLGHPPTERNVVSYMIGNQNNPSSIINSLRFARESCRTVREILPREAWENLNEHFLFARENIQAGLTRRGRIDYIDGIITGSQMFNGLLSSIMYRDEAWEFLRIGRNIERAEMTTRIIDVQSTDLLTDSEELYESRSLESAQLISILRSLSAYSVYRRKSQVRVSRVPVLDLLFHDTQFPRAFAHCILAVEESLGTLAHSAQTLQTLKSVERRLARQKMDQLDQEGLHEFIDELQLGIIHFHTALEKQYFLPPLQ
jgi:uncharacterized alpha-E superfamily protein